MTREQMLKKEKFDAFEDLKKTNIARRDARNASMYNPHYSENFRRAIEENEKAKKRYNLACKAYPRLVRESDIYIDLI